MNKDFFFRGRENTKSHILHFSMALRCSLKGQFFFFHFFRTYIYERLYRICSTSDKISSIITTPATQPSFSFNKYSLVVWNERDKLLEFRRNITFTRTPSMNVWFFPVFASNSAHLAVVSKVTTYSKYSLPFPVLQLTKFAIPFEKFFFTFYI